MEDTEVFQGKTLSDLFKEVHSRSVARRELLMGMVTHLKGLIRDADTAVALAPMISSYMDVLGRSDEHLIKIATIVQRLVSAQSYKKGVSGPEDLLSEDEKSKLLADLSTEFNELEQKIKALPSAQNE